MKAIKLVIPAAALGIIAGITSFETPESTNQSASFADKFWKVETITVSPAIDLDMDGKPDTDMKVMMEDCDKDDAEMFKSNNKIMKDGGEEKCDEEEEDIFESGTWKYDAAAKKITIKHHNTEKPSTATVKEVSATRLVLTSTFTSNKGNHNIIAVYKVK